MNQVGDNLFFFIVHGLNLCSKGPPGAHTASINYLIKLKNLEVEQVAILQY